MASVWKRVRPREGKPDLKTWEVRWREPSGRQRRRSFAKQSDAERFRTHMESNLQNGSYVSPDRAKITVGTYAELWMGRRTGLKPKTVVSYRTLLDQWVLPRWKTVSLGKIDYEDVVTWVADMAGEVSASTTCKAYHILTSLLDDAVKARRLPFNPAAGVELPRLPKSKKRYLSHQQVADFAAACGEQDGLIVQMLAYTGLRWSELAGLRVGRVSLGARRIHVAEAAVEVNGKIIFGSPKSHADRWVGVPPHLRDAVAAHIAGKYDDDLLFTSPKGEVLRVNNFRRRNFDKAAAKIGLKGLIPHELRHTAASLAIAAGANVKDVQNMLGHKSAAMTLDLYGHLLDDAPDAVADRMSAARAQAVVSPACPQTTSSTA